MGRRSETKHNAHVWIDKQLWKRVREEGELTGETLTALVEQALWMLVFDRERKRSEGSEETR